MTSRDPKCGNIGIPLLAKKFLNVKERTIYCKIEHSNRTEIPRSTERIIVNNGFFPLDVSNYQILRFHHYSSEIKKRPPAAVRAWGLSFLQAVSDCLINSRLINTRFTDAFFDDIPTAGGFNNCWSCRLQAGSDGRMAMTWSQWQFGLTAANGFQRSLTHRCDKREKKYNKR